MSPRSHPEQPQPDQRVPGAQRRSSVLLRDLFGVVATGFLAVVLVAGLGATFSQPARSAASELVEVELDLPDDAALPELEERSTVFAGDGTLLAVLDRETTRRSVALERIPLHVRQAVIAAEDRKFYEHPGYDVEGIGRAVVANLRAGDIAEGGSTITQQLAKSEVGADRTFERKAAELMYAMALERKFSKDELLQRYLNLVYFGSRAYGIAAAADEYFHTTPRRLTVHQSAMLAALISAPNSTDPRRHPRIAKQRRNDVLRAMAEEGYVPTKRLPRLLRRSLGVKASSPEQRTRYSHVVDAVQRELLQLEELGPTPQAREQRLYFGGLRVRTTLDVDMQRRAKRTILRYLPHGTPTAAIATVDPATGEIKAIASGLSYRNLKYDLPTQGRRQPGSAFKPFVYAAALQDGFPLDMALAGSSPSYFEGVPGWERDCNSHDKEVCGVANYDDASYGTLDMPTALKKSVNSAAAQLTVLIGDERVAELAGDMGIDIESASNGTITESIGLGGLDQGVTPLELASAYAVFANEGERVRPHLVSSVENAAGDVIYEAPSKRTEILDPLVNAAVVDMMKGVVTGGTGTAAALPFTDVAGKTGTTSNNVDAWFAGYTPVLSTAVWVGHAAGQIEMPGMTGGALPATIWHDYMRGLVKSFVSTRFPEPDLEALADRLGDVEVAVPGVVGMSEAEALERLGTNKLVGQVLQVPADAPLGTVVATSPAAGEQTVPGSEVLLSVSDGSASPGLQFPIYVPPPLSFDADD